MLTLMANQNEQDPNTSVPHDEATDEDAGGRTAEPSTSPRKEQPDPNTTVPHDVD